MKALCTLLGIVLLAALVIAMLGTAVFIGIGALLSQWLPVSLFQAAILAIGATVAVALVVHVGATIVQCQAQQPWSDPDDEWEIDDESDPIPGLTQTDLPKVGRNVPCPCESGKKFKNCCGKTPLTH